MSERKRLIYSTIFPLLMLTVMWLTKLFEHTYEVSFGSFGILPRTFSGLWGILLAPLLHGDFEHLLSNSFPIFLFGTLLFYFFRDSAFRVSVFLWLGTGFWVWLAARAAFHIGASGIVYGLAGFLVFSGILTKNRALASISLIIILFYGSMIWGVFPGENGISWESHLLGGFTGFLLALWYARKYSTPAHDRFIQKEIWEDDFSAPTISSSKIKSITYEYIETDSESDS